MQTTTATTRVAIPTRVDQRDAACKAAQLALCAVIAAGPDPYEQAERDAAERRQWEAGLALALAGEGEAL